MMRLSCAYYKDSCGDRYCWVFSGKRLPPWMRVGCDSCTRGLSFISLVGFLLALLDCSLDAGPVDMRGGRVCAMRNISNCPTFSSCFESISIGPTFVPSFRVLENLIQGSFSPLRPCSWFAHLSLSITYCWSVVGDHEHVFKDLQAHVAVLSFSFLSLLPTSPFLAFPVPKL